MKKMILLFTLVAVLVMPATVAAEEPEANVSVRVNAPEFVSGTFEVTIDIEDVADFDSGQFNLSFNPDVVSFVDVEPGSIGDTEVPIDMSPLIEAGKVQVLFNIKGADGVHGSGYLAKVVFETEGVLGDVSIMNISDGLLVGINPDMDGGDSSTWTTTIPADWFNDTVTIGTGPSTPAETPTPTQAPTIAVASAPEPTATSVETPSLELASDPSTFTARAWDASSENGESQDLLTPHNFINIYSFVGLLAFIYSLTLLK